MKSFQERKRRMCVRKEDWCLRFGTNIFTQVMVAFSVGVLERKTC